MAVTGTGETICVAYVARGGADDRKHVYFNTSTDRGYHWASPVRIDGTYMASWAPSLMKLSIYGQRLIAAFLGNSSGYNRVWCIRSTDYGQNWGDLHLVNDNSGNYDVYAPSLSGTPRD